MEFVYILITILLAIVVSDVLSKIFKSIPSIFFHILIGVLISYLPFFREFELDAELIMLIIIKPLIFSEAQKLSFEQLKKYYRPIFSLSIFLVIITVIITAKLVNLIFPKIPIALTFMLIAMIIPTNATILESISKNLKFPHGMFHILEGESLFNECIAVLLFDLALVAVTTNEFHIQGLVHEFIFSLIGGLIVGIIVGTLIVLLRGWLEKKNFESPAMMVSIQIMTPFIVYIIAAKVFHVSGILAVIVTGMLHSIEKPMLNIRSTKLQVISDSTWDVIHYLLDGIIAIYLGLILRSVISNVEHGGIYSIQELVFISGIVYCVVIVLRFVWVIIQPSKFKIASKDVKELINGSLVYALSGVHGTVTLLIAISIPTLMYNEEIFVLRQELIFIASIVILMSIVIPSIVFPMILPKKQQKISSEVFEQVKQETIYYAIFELERTYDKKDDNVMAVIDILRKQLAYLKKTHSKKFNHDDVEKVLMKATEIELTVIEELIKTNQISRANGVFYQHYIMNANKNNIFATYLNLKMAHIRHHIEKSISNKQSKRLLAEYKVIKDFKLAKQSTCTAVIDYLNEEINEENYDTMSFVREYYRKKRGNGINQFDTDKNKQIIKKYISKAFGIQHIFIQDQIEKGLISSALGDELIESISYDEMIYYKSLN